MIAVIFRATMLKVDDEYFQTAARLRDLAKAKYGCIEFTSCSEGDDEIAISYWHSEAQIQHWKNDPVHKAAQQKGREKWYKSYSVEICEIKQGYKGQ